MSIPLRIGLSIAVLAAVLLPGSSAPWPGFRGPDGRAVSAEKDLPVR